MTVTITRTGEKCFTPKFLAKNHKVFLHPILTFFEGFYKVLPLNDPYHGKLASTARVNSTTIFYSEPVEEVYEATC